MVWGVKRVSRMPRRLRWIPDGSMVEITSRTNGARFLMRPNERMNRRILGVLGRALAMYPVTLYAFAFLSNHYHLLAKAMDRAALTDFLRYFNGQLARAIQDETGWDLLVWQRRAEVIPIVDDAAAEDRLRYILAQGAKEGLVASPLDWPGVSSTRALLGREQLVGTWRNRSLASRRLAAGREPDPGEVDSHYPITLAPLPAWEPFTPAERHAMVAEMVEQIEREAHDRHPQPLGVANVLAQSPFEHPRQPKRGPAPLAHASTEEGYIVFRGQHRAWVDDYRRAADDLKRSRGTWFPGPCFMPAVLYRAKRSYVGFTPPPDTAVARPPP